MLLLSHSIFPASFSDFIENAVGLMGSKYQEISKQNDRQTGANGKTIGKNSKQLLSCFPFVFN